MKYGVFGLGNGIADPALIARAAAAAERAGLESLWLGELIALPSPRTPLTPEEPETPYLDPLAVLAHLAAATERINLGAGVVIASQRHPLFLAKEAATVDVLSGGRLLLGIGAGYLPEQFASLGIPFAERGSRTDEVIDAVRALWSAEQPSFAGRHFQFDGIDAHPRPLRGDVPIIIGGHGAPGLRRAVQHGNGWFGWKLDIERTERTLARLRGIAEQSERPVRLGKLEITITPTEVPTAAEARRFAGLGVDRLVPELPRDEAGIFRTIEQLGDLAAATR